MPYLPLVLTFAVLAVGACTSLVGPTSGDAASADTVLDVMAEVTTDAVTNHADADVSPHPDRPTVPADVDDPGRFADVRRIPLAQVVQRLRPSCPDPATRGCDVVAMRGATFAVPGRFGAPDPINNFTLSGFALDRYEVSVARFRRFIEAGAPPAAFPMRYPGGTVTGFAPRDAAEARIIRPCTSSRLPGEGTHLDPACTWTPEPGPNESLPIVSYTSRSADTLNWFTMQSFCVWDGGRLPTDVEWLYAAFWLRDGRSVPRRYSMGDTWDCDSAVVSGGATPCGMPVTIQAIGSRRPEGLFYDLSGNAAEVVAGTFLAGSLRCWDSAPATDPLCLGPGGTVLGTSLGDSFAAAQPSTVHEFYQTNGDPYATMRCAYPLDVP